MLNHQPKQGIYMLAYVLGMDFSNLKEYEYQAGQFTQKVFYVDDVLYCPYKTKPTDRAGSYAKENWIRKENLPHPYERSIVWVYQE